MAAEKDFENKIKDWLHTVGIYPSGCPMCKMTVPQVGWYVKVWGGGYQKSGIPDILICVQGYFVACEIKAPKGIPTALQLVNLREIHTAGGFAVLLYPDDFEKFKNTILQLIRTTDKKQVKPTYRLLTQKWLHFENKIIKGE